MALWTGGMVGTAHVPRHELEVEARARGFELSDHFLKKYAACERAFAAALRKHEPEKSEG